MPHQNKRPTAVSKRCAIEYPRPIPDCKFTDDELFWDEEPPRSEDSFDEYYDPEDGCPPGVDEIFRKNGFV